MEEGKIYVFINIGCIPAAYYRPVTTDDRLRINAGTHISENTEVSGTITPYHFAAKRVNRDTILTDLIGLLTKIEDPRLGNTKFGEGTRSKFYMQDIDGNEFPVSLWGDLSLKFRELNLLETHKTTIIVVCGLSI